METALLPNLLGFSGVALNVLWPFLRGRTAMLWGQALGAFLFGLHYVLVGAYTGSIMATLAGLQAVLAIPLGTRPGFRKIYLGMLPVIALGLALSWQGWPSVFASIAMAVTSIGRYQTEVLRFRALLLACVPFWTGHNLIVGSIPGLSSDALTIASGGYMLWWTWKQQRLVGV